MTTTEHLTDSTVKEAEQHSSSNGGTISSVPPGGGGGQVGARLADSSPAPASIDEGGVDASTNEQQPSPRRNEPPGAYTDLDFTPPIADNFASTVRESVLTHPQASTPTIFPAILRRIAVATASLLAPASAARSQPAEPLDSVTQEDPAPTPQARAPAIVGPHSSVAQHEAPASSVPVSPVDGPTSTLPVPPNFVAQDQAPTPQDPTMDEPSLSLLKLEAPASSVPAPGAQDQTSAMAEPLNSVDQQVPASHGPASTVEGQTSGRPEGLNPVTQEEPASTQEAQNPVMVESCSSAVPQQEGSEWSGPASTAEGKAFGTPEPLNGVDQGTPTSFTPAPSAEEQTSGTLDVLNGVDREDPTSFTPLSTAEEQTSGTSESLNAVDQEASASSTPTPTTQVQSSETPESLNTVDQEASTSSAPASSAQSQTTGTPESLKAVEKKAPASLTPASSAQDQTTGMFESLNAVENEAPASSIAASSARDETSGIVKPSNAIEKEALASIGHAPPVAGQTSGAPGPLNAVDQEAPTSSAPPPTAEGQTSGTPAPLNPVEKEDTASHTPTSTVEGQGFAPAFDPLVKTHHTGSIQPRARIAESPQRPPADVAQKASATSASTAQARSRVLLKLPASQEEHSSPTIQLQTTTAERSNSSTDFQQIQGDKSKSKRRLYKGKSHRHSKSLAPFNTTDVILLVTGSVGSGRSTFINALLSSDATPMAVGEDWSVAVCTKRIDHTVVYLSRPPPYNRLVLVDTPGFNNYDKPDADVVQDILNWLEEHFDTNEKYRAGVIYLHDLTEPRYQGVGVSDLKPLDNIRKRNQLQRLLMVTTKWNRIDEAGGNRQHSLLEARWAGILQSGAKLERYKEKEDAWRIVGDFLPTLYSSVNEVDIRKLVAEITRHRPPWSVKHIWSTAVASINPRK